MPHKPKAFKVLSEKTRKMVPLFFVGGLKGVPNQSVHIGHLPQKDATISVTLMSQKIPGLCATAFASLKISVCKAFSPSRPG